MSSSSSSSSSSEPDCSVLSILDLYRRRGQTTSNPRSSTSDRGSAGKEIGWLTNADLQNAAPIVQ